MMTFDPTDQAFWMTIGTAMLCGALVGVERQARGKPAGIRTSMLVCLGTSIFISLGSQVNGPGAADPTRVLGQLVTGVGFLGAGVMFSREGIVTGVTTAAVIWMLAAIGAVNGLGFHLGAIVVAGLTVGILIGVELLEKSTLWLARGIYHRNSD